MVTFHSMKHTQGFSRLLKMEKIKWSFRVLRLQVKNSGCQLDASLQHPCEREGHDL